MRYLPLSLFVVALGCGGGAEVPPLAQVSGRVTRAGEPVNNLQVFFQPAGGGRGSSGLTDENGGFSLDYTRDEPGVMRGNHKVYVGYMAQTPEEESNPPEPYATIIAKYGDAESSPLEVTVDEDVTDLELKLD